VRTTLFTSSPWNRYTFAAGVENIFDQFPDRNRLGTTEANLGIFTYPRQSPYGMNGRFVYSRVDVRF
jgi:iron complex outermembrane receptor protein